MSGGPINPDREQQEADNRASRRQSTIGPLPAELEDEQGRDDEDRGDEREERSDDETGSAAQ